MSEGVEAQLALMCVSAGDEVPAQGLQQGPGVSRGRRSFLSDIHNPLVHTLPADLTCVCVSQERREREQQDLEFAKEMAEDDDDSFP